MHGGWHPRIEDNLSRYIRLIEAGERVVVTAHGRVVAELVPPAANRQVQASQFDQLIAAGVITPPVEDGDPLEDCPEIGLSPGTAAALIDLDRDEASGRSRPPNRAPRQFLDNCQACSG